MAAKSNTLLTIGKLIAGTWDVYTERQIGHQEISVRYAAAQVITVYSDKIARVRKVEPD